MSGSAASAAPDAAAWAHLLEPGERLLWTGQPDGGLHARLSDLPAAAVGAVLLAVSVWLSGIAGPSLVALFPFGVVATPGGGPGLVVRLVALALALQGLWALAGRLLWQSFLRRHSRYALTDRRALILTEPFGAGRLSAHRVGPAMPLALEDGPLPTVWFAERWRAGPEPDRPQRRTRIGFEYIADGVEVHRMLATLREGRTP